jgi:hypothetical protein
MRKTVIWGVVLVCLTVLIAGSGATAQRARVIETAAASRPTQVEVTNFPAVQPVNGTVNVGNLPAVQSVAGSVAVSNLPIDAAGNVRISGILAPAPAIHFIGVTTAIFYIDAGPLNLSRECNAEIPNTRMCDYEELFKTMPPPNLPPFVLLSAEYATLPNTVCISGAGDTYNQVGQPVCPFEQFPAACCGL